MVRSTCVVLSALALLALAASCRSSIAPQPSTPLTQDTTVDGYRQGLVPSQSDLARFTPEAIDKCLDYVGRRLAAEMVDSAEQDEADWPGDDLSLEDGLRRWRRCVVRAVRCRVRGRCHPSRPEEGAPR